MIIPAIDIIDGCCVRLTQGDYGRATTYFKDPLEAAKRFEDCGLERLHVVDLDGAKASQPVNLRSLERIATHTSMAVQYGGGIKSEGALHSAFDAGASRAICGSVAVSHPEEVIGWLNQFGADRIILGADFRDGKVAVKGWLENSPLSVEQLIDRFTPHGLSQVICTDIARDGMLCGPDVDYYRRLSEKYPAVEIIVSGGISSMADVDAAHAAGLPYVIVGKAIYDGRITFDDLRRCLPNA